MAMKIDAKLNIVIPVESDKGTIYVHSTPISHYVFERYFLTISKAFTAIYAGGLGTIAGPRISMLLLKKTAEDDGDWDGEDGVQRGLVAEIRRLSNVILPTENGGGWQTIPLEVCVSRKILSPEDISEVENAIAFFIISTSMQRRAMLKVTLGGMASIWGVQTTSLGSTEFAGSLTTSTMPVTTGEKEITSSLPS